MSVIETAETFYNQDGVMGDLQNGTLVPVAQWAHWRYGPPVDVRKNPAGDAEGPAVEAFVNHGRWLVQCPNQNCCSAQIASSTDQRFYCATCENDFVSNQTIPVVWPDEMTLASIEELLTPRPLFFRNWKPDETIELLMNDNIRNAVSS